MTNASQGTLSDSLHAGKWSLLNTLVQKGLVFGTFLVLARILQPVDFGIVALLMIAPSFLDGITSLSFDTAAIQKRNIERYLNVIWTFNIIRASIIFVIVALAAPFVADFFRIHEPIYALSIAGFGVLAQNFSNIGMTYYFVNLDLSRIFIRDTVAKVGYALATILLALAWPSFWAPYLGNFVSIIIITIATYFLHPYRPRFDFELWKLRELFPLSGWLYLQEMFAQVMRSTEDSMIGKFAPPAELGLFGKAKALAQAPTSPIISMINKISFTSYTRVQDNSAAVADGIHKTFDLLLALAIPYMLAIIFTGRRIVLILLGENWIALTPFLQILVFVATLDVLFVTLGYPVFNATNNSRRQFFVAMINSGLVLAGYFLWVPTYGAMGAAYAILLGMTVSASFVLYSLLTLFPIKLSRVFASVCVVLFSSVVPIALGQYLLKLEFFNHTLGYILLFGIASTLYTGLIIFFGTYLKAGPYATLRVIYDFFIRLALRK